MRSFTLNSLSRVKGLTFSLMVLCQFFTAPESKGTEVSPTVKTFRLHLNSEPSSLAPWEQRGSQTGYFLSQIFGTLLKLRNGKLTSAIAEQCKYTGPTLLRCKIKTMARYSDGTPITAEDFRRSWLDFLQPAHHAYRADLFFPIKNAELFYLGKAKPQAVGISVKKNDLLIELEKPDPDFIYSLTSPLFTALKDTKAFNPKDAAQFISSGAYHLTKWLPNERISLLKNDGTIAVEFLFIQEDSVALNLYERSELQFLRRLPTLFIKKFKTRADFHQVAQVRLDYFGFGPALDAWPDLRAALSLSLDFSEIQNLLSSPGELGCPGLPDSLMKNRPCLRFDLKLAKEKLALASKIQGSLPKLSFHYSKQGGEDHKLVAEWLQNQWLKNLNLKVELKPTENKIFVDLLRNDPPAIFRKGINPDRPTCRSALEFFLPDSSENFLRLQKKSDGLFFTKLEQMSTNHKPQDLPLLCTEAISYLNQNYKWIPTGLIHFTVLADPKWQGWRLNELNQLDLSELKFVSK